MLFYKVVSLCLLVYMGLDNYFNLFLLMGAVLSILLSGYLLFYPSDFFANKVLGILAFSWAITVFAYIMYSTDFFIRYPHFYALVDVFVLLFFPLIYIYVRTYLYEDARSVSKYLIHFLPAALYLILFSPFLLKSAEAKIEIINGNAPTWLSPLQMAFNSVVIAQGVVYTIFSLRKLHHFQFFRKARLSRFQLNSLKWLRLFVILNIFLWMIGTVAAILEMFRIDMVVDLFGLFYFGLTILTLVLGAFTVSRPEFFSEDEDIVKYVSRRYVDNADDTAISDCSVLIDYIENEKPYLKPDLKMQDLVKGTGLSYKQISELFNNELNKSFYEVINYYRIKMAFQLIQDGFHKKHTLPHLAEEAGFNSKTTFNRIFKKYTSQTPTEYIQSNNL